MTLTEINLDADTLDSRDIIDRIEELANLLEDEDSELTAHDIEEEYTDEVEELKILREFASQGENFSSWTYGITLVSEDHLEDYIRERAEEDVPSELPEYIKNAIDWSEVCDVLRSDYSTIEAGGRTFYTDEH